MLQARFGRAPFFVTNDHDGPAIEGRHAADDRLVIAVDAVTRKLLKIGEHALDEIARVRTIRMARDLRFPPGRKVLIEILQLLGRLLFEFLQILGERGGIALALLEFQLRDASLKLGNRLFKFEICRHGA